MQQSVQVLPLAFPHGARGSIGTVVALTLFIAAVLGIAIWISVCPCERIPGSYLMGDIVEEPVTDWSFINSDVELCQIEVKRGLLPHSINLNCMGKMQTIPVSNAATLSWFIIASAPLPA